MACNTISPPTAPVLPTGFTFGGAVIPPVPNPLNGVKIPCCTILPFPPLTPPIPIPPGTLNSALMAAINEGIATLIALIQPIPIKCPRE